MNGLPVSLEIRCYVYRRVLKIIRDGLGGECDRVRIRIATGDLLEDIRAVKKVTDAT